MKSLAGTLAAPFPWFGGKSLACETVWQALGDVQNYVEPFAGSAAMLLGRPHEPGVETINDADGFVANFWRAVAQDAEAVALSVDWPCNEADLLARHARALAPAGATLHAVTASFGAPYIATPEAAATADLAVPAAWQAHLATHAAPDAVLVASDALGEVVVCQEAHAALIRCVEQFNYDHGR